MTRIPHANRKIRSIIKYELSSVYNLNAALRRKQSGHVREIFFWFTVLRLFVLADIIYHPIQTCGSS